MKKLLTTLSILILLIGATILTSNKVYAMTSSQPMKLTNITTQSNQTVLTFEDIKGNDWQAYGTEDTDKIGLIYNVTMDDDKLIDYKATNIVEGNMIIDLVYYNEVNHTYDMIVLDEHENNIATAYEIELIKADKENQEITQKLNDILKDKTVHVKIDTKGTVDDLRDDKTLECSLVN